MNKYIYRVRVTTAPGTSAIYRKYHDTYPLARADAERVLAEHNGKVRVDLTKHLVFENQPATAESEAR